MKLSERIKPISYLKANAAEVIAKLAEHQQPMIITVNGEAKAVLQDIDSYEEMQEAIALMKTSSRWARRKSARGRFCRWTRRSSVSATVQGSSRCHALRGRR